MEKQTEVKEQNNKTLQKMSPAEQKRFAEAWIKETSALRKRFGKGLKDYGD